jgi:hypothetical protein
MRRMGLGDADMRRIEMDILAAPQSHPVIQGLKGVRKARFARPGGGKRGGGRVIYFLAIPRESLFMLTAYPKSERDDLSPAQRKAILQAITSIGRAGP